MTPNDAATRPKMDDVNVELEVIQAVGHAIAQLPSPEAQRRVLQWINDRFQPTASRPTAGRPAPEAQTGDSMLGLEGVEELFERPGVTPTIHRSAVDPKEPNVAAAVPEDARLDSLVHGFVRDFQRVALEWQGA